MQGIMSRCCCKMAYTCKACSILQSHSSRHLHCCCCGAFQDCTAWAPLQQTLLAWHASGLHQVHIWVEFVCFLQCSRVGSSKVPCVQSTAAATAATVLLTTGVPDSDQARVDPRHGCISSTGGAGSQSKPPSLHSQQVRFNALQLLLCFCWVAAANLASKAAWQPCHASATALRHLLQLVSTVGCVLKIGSQPHVICNH